MEPNNVCDSSIMLQRVFDVAHLLLGSETSDQGQVQFETTSGKTLEVQHDIAQQSNTETTPTAVELQLLR
jgi:hypothetical protein